MVPPLATVPILTMRHAKQHEQINAKLSMTDQFSRIKVRPQQDLWSQLPGQAGQCQHLEQLQLHLLLALSSSKRGHHPLLTGFPTFETLLESRNRSHQVGPAGPTPHRGSTRTSSNEPGLPITTGAVLLLMSMKNPTLHNSRKQLTMKQLQSKLHHHGFPIESATPNMYQSIQLQSTGRHHH